MSVAPTISVVIPCYNARLFLAETLQSVLSQTYGPHEVLVVDDGSTDESAAIASGFGPPVRVISQKNSGESVARNRGIEEATGDWVALLDADDTWHPRKLEKQISACANDRIVCSHTHFFLNYTDHQVAAEPAPEFFGHETYAVEDVILAFVLPSSALIRRRSTVRFPEWTRDGEDVVYFSELSLTGQFAFVNEPLVGYRKHAAGQSSNPQNIVKNRMSCLEWLQRNEARLGSERRAAIEARILADLLHRLEMAKWRRAWPRYWAIRRYLAGHSAVAQHPLVQERIFPPIMYAAKDRVDRLLGRADTASQRSASDASFGER